MKFKKSRSNNSEESEWFTLLDKFIRCELRENDCRGKHLQEKCSVIAK